MSGKMDGVPEKAYIVRDDWEGFCVVVFAHHGIVARRRGAVELDIEFSSVESCNRAPGFDQYSPGPVPQLALLEAGWWAMCQHCEAHCYLDDGAICVNDDVYCSESCKEASEGTR